MSWIDQALDRLAGASHWGYFANGVSAAEPAALAAIALTAHGRDAARPMQDWLASIQQPDGSVGVTAAESTPCWPTSLAVLAWHAAERRAPYEPRMQNALSWILKTKGEVLPRTPEMGHDSTLTGWPWVEGTHSWNEPTAMHVLALKTAGHTNHPRTREAVQMLQDRLLPTGGCNYGNTFVLGQMLIPHLEPTGLSLLALAGEIDSDGRAAKSIAYLRRTLSSETATASLCYGLMGLAAHDALPPDAQSWLALASNRTIAHGPSAFKLALLALAALGNRCPLIPPRIGGAPTAVSLQTIPLTNPTTATPAAAVQ